MLNANKIIPKEERCWLMVSEVSVQGVCLCLEIDRRRNAKMVKSMKVKRSVISWYLGRRRKGWGEMRRGGEQRGGMKQAWRKRMRRKFLVFLVFFS